MLLMLNALIMVIDEHQGEEGMEAERLLSSAPHQAGSKRAGGMLPRR